ncbi:MAG TPA: substrate-binding domain-containing protein, partial [Burkholderiales bacterium]|nr:substrate-binding domain-containing protein [Burkholderiales bacterium]
MKNKRMPFARLLLPTLLLALMSHQAHPQTANGGRAAQGKLIVTGSGVMVPLVSGIARRFESAHPGVKIDVQPGGSGKALADLRAGACDIGMLARSLRQGERDLFASAIARDGVAIMVHRDNPVKRIDASQLREVLTGRLANWKALGGRDAPVKLGWRSKGEGAVELMLDHLKLKRDQIGPHVLLTTSADAIKLVGHDPNGMAMASVG